MRTRRTRAEMLALDSMLIALVVKYGPATVRQIFYLATTKCSRRPRRPTSASASAQVATA